MSTQLTFAEAFLYPDDPSGITMPVVLIYGGKAIRISPKVDTGAAVCLFSHEDGLKLSLPATQGMLVVLSSLGGSLAACGHEATLQTGTLAFQSLVYFAKYPVLPRNILGRQCAFFFLSAQPPGVGDPSLPKVLQP